MMLRRLLFATCAASLAAHAGATELRGVWRGTLGDAPIVACFDDGDHGDYFYGSRGYSLILDRNAPDDTWDEGEYSEDGEDVSGHWRDWTADGAGLAATWVSPDGKRTLPIRLRRIAAGFDAEAHCSAGDVPAYEAERLAHTRIETGPSIDLPLRRLVGDEPVASGVRGHVLSAFHGDLRMLQLEAEDDASRRINGALLALLHEDIATRYTCVVRGEPGDFTSGGVELVALDARWIGVRRVGGGYCGGAHPDTFQDIRLFDRRTGDSVDAHDWLGDGDELSADLPTLALAHYPAQPATTPEDAQTQSECREAWSNAMPMHVDAWPAPGGLVLSPDLPHVVDYCSDDVFVPRAELEKYLTDAGRSAIPPAH
jgi:hypothetical protein